MANVTLTWDYESNVVDTFLICRSLSQMNITSLADANTYKIGELPSSSRTFVDVVIEPQTQYHYAVVTVQGTNFKVSSEVIVTTGEEGGGALTFDPRVDLNCILYADVSTAVISDGFVTSIDVSLTSDKKLLNKVGRGVAKANLDCIALESCGFSNPTLGNMINGLENTTLFILSEKTKPNSLNKGADGPLFFLAHDTQNRNRFSLFHKGEDGKINNPQSWIRNLTWTNSTIYQPSITNEPAFYTMFARWLKGESGLSTIYKKVKTKSQSKYEGGFAKSDGTSLGIGTDNLTASCNANVYCVVVVKNEHTEDLQNMLEGWAAWKFNKVSLLPDDHRFKRVPPQKGDTF